MTAIEFLDQQARQLYPNYASISIGRWDDNTTWRIDLTDGTRIAANTVFPSFDKTAYDATQPVELTLEQRFAAFETRVAALERRP